jgi:hypothetical protein
MAILILGAPFILALVKTAAPEIVRFFGYVNLACLIVIALLTGGRLADAGYRRWVGTASVLAIGVGLPVVAGLGLAFVLPGGQTELILVAALAGMVVVLLIFVIWAGTRRSVAHEDPDDGLGDSRIESRRIEPRL